MAQVPRDKSTTPPAWRQYWGVAVGLVLGWALSGWLAWQLYHDAVRQDEARFEIESGQIAAMLEQEMERYEERLGRLADFCARNPDLSRQQWSFRQGTIADFSYNLPCVIHAVYCPKVLPQDFDRHFAKGCEVWKGGYRFDPTERPDRPFALPAWTHYSRGSFVPVKSGTDMAAPGNGFPGLGQALRRSAWVSPAPCQVRTTNGTVETGFWFSHSLFSDEQGSTRWELPGESIAQRGRRHSDFLQESARGVLAVFISTDRMVEANFNERRPTNGVHVRLYASKQPSAASLLNPRSKPPPNPRHRRVIEQRWYGRGWCVELVSTRFFEQESSRYRTWVALGGGVSLTLLACGLVGVSIRAQVGQERIMKEVMDARDALAAAEKERERLGHDLHDGAIQTLYAIQLGLTRTGERLSARDRSSSRLLHETRERIDEVIAELRRFILSAERGAAGGASVGLEELLASMVRGLEATTPQVVLHLNVDPKAAAQVPVSACLPLTQVARSAIANSLRHARAGKVTISVESAADAVVLTVADDGVGFDPARFNGDGIGLKTMETRVRELGGEWKIDSRPGSGTRVVATIPAGDPVATMREAKE